MKRWFVYVLLNQKNEAYTGITYDENVDRRLSEHNGERAGGAKYTRPRRPWQLIYVESGFLGRSEAQIRERQIKSDRKLKMKLKEFV
jgi:putative endonuclease